MKLNKEERKAIVKAVTNKILDDYHKKLEIAQQNYVPSEKYLKVQRIGNSIVQQIEELKALGVENWSIRADQSAVDTELNHIRNEEINIKRPSIDTERIESELILKSIGSDMDVDTLINELVKSVTIE